MSTRAVILDDEKPSIVSLKWKLETYCPDVEVVATFDDPVQALSYLRATPPELLFLDVEMPMLNGFDVLEELGENAGFDVIFTTAHEQFGIQAIKCSALDYLLKPVQNKELQLAVQKHLHQASGRRPGSQIRGLLDNVTAERQGKPAKIALATKESIEFVEPGAIICCVSDSNYTMVHLSDNRKKLISRTLKDVEITLFPYAFYRPHHSYLINLSEVREFMRADGGYLIMTNGMKIPVTKSRRMGLLERLT